MTPSLLLAALLPPSCGSPGEDACPEAYRLEFRSYGDAPWDRFRFELEGHPFGWPGSGEPHCLELLFHGGRLELAEDAEQGDFYSTSAPELGYGGRLPG